MKYRQFGKTGWDVSEISVGTWQIIYTMFRQRPKDEFFAADDHRNISPHVHHLW